MIVKNFERVRNETLLFIYFPFLVCFSKSDNSCCIVMCFVRDLWQQLL